MSRLTEGTLLRIPILFLICSELILISLTLSSSPVQGSPSDHTDVDEESKYIKKSLSKIPFRSFLSFPVLVQQVNRAQDSILYINHAATEGKEGRHFALSRNITHYQRPVIIFCEHDAHLSMLAKGGEGNRVFAVLIQNLRSSMYYHAAYAYVRDVPFRDSNDDSVVTIDRKRRRVEWDTFEERIGEENKAATMGWTTCLESFFVPCKPVVQDAGEVVAMEEDQGEHDEEKDNVKLKLKFVEDGASLHVAECKVESGYVAGVHLPYFADLRDTPHQAHFVGAVVDAVTDVVQFFHEAANKFSGTNESHELEEAVRVLVNGDLMVNLLLDLKNVGNYSLPADGKPKNMSLLIAEGYRVLQGILNNSRSDRMAELLALDIFSDDDESRGRTPQSEVGQIQEALKMLAPAGNPRGVRRKRNLLANILGTSSFKKGGGGTADASKGNNIDFKAGFIPGKIGGDVKGVDWRLFCAKPNLSPGEKGWCGCHKGKEHSYGLSESIGDAVSEALAGKSNSDDPSVLDPIFNTAIASFFCGTAASVIDLGNSIVGPLGLSPLLGQLSDIAGNWAGTVGGGPIVVGHLIHQGVKALGNLLGIGGLIGMKGRGRGINMAAVSGIRMDNFEDVETDVDFFARVGWITEDLVDVRKAETDPTVTTRVFIGFGPCRSPPIEPSDFDIAENLFDVARVFHRVLRTHCYDRHEALLNEIVDEEYFIVNEDKSLSISDTAPHIRDGILTEHHFDRLTLAMGIATFSQEYMTEVLHPVTGPQNPADESIHKPVNTLIRFALRYVRDVRQIVPQHFVKLTRDLIFTLKLAFIKSLQDYYRVNDCSGITIATKAEFNNNSKTILGMILFLIEGLDPVEKHHMGVVQAWTSFFKLNKKHIEAKLRYYTSFT